MFFNSEGPVYGTKGGNWYSKVTLVGDEIRLIYSSENNIYYKKLNP